MAILTIPPGADAMAALAGQFAAQAAAAGTVAHDGLILLPTRRAARALAAEFLRRSAGGATLLPRILALGGLDEAPLALAGALDLPPAITQPHRIAVLARLILARGGRDGAPRHADRAWTLAGELALLMDEAERAEQPLADGLARAADPAYAMHWEHTLVFMRIVTEAWPAYLAEQGLMNPAARQVALLDAQCRAWTETPPGHPVLAVGNAGDIPAIGRLLRVVAGLPHGTVVLPGLDLALDDDSWDRLDEAHPQYGLRALLIDGLLANRGDVRPLEVPEPPGERDALLRRALLPAACLGGWQEPFSPDLTGIARIDPTDGQTEAATIALVLRDALQTPGTVAALVTPDRRLAERVAAELGRWGVVADDSAGEPLGQTPPAVFLRLIADALADRLAPVALLAVLKHPLAGLGLAPAETRRLARRLERACLRGPRPDPHLAGLRRAVATAGGRHRGQRPDATADEPDTALDAFLARIEACLEPALRVHAQAHWSPADRLATLVQAAEACAATDTQTGPARLWALEEGEALATYLAEAIDAVAVLPDDAPHCLPGLLRAMLDGQVVRSRRATRGREAGGREKNVEHPRVFIWGLLEARLQRADVMVLGGLTEGSWPPATDPGPWMSRPMRARAGLPSAEARIGQAAHDFCMAACAAPQLVLSVPRRRDGAPAVPSRWLVRLTAMLGDRTPLPTHPAGAWLAGLDHPAGGPAPVPPPRPCPPLAARPRRLSVSDVAVLLADPYEIHARRILRLDVLDPLEQAADFRDYGNVVHAGLDGFLTQAGLAWPADAAPRIAQALQDALRKAGLRDALIAWWTPRLQRIADWVDTTERRRRATARPELIRTEATGEWVLDRPGGAFVLRGRADRMERSADGTLAIFDYKTGTLPRQKDVEAGNAPQLLLEAAMAHAGAFGPELRRTATELVYWRLNGGHAPGQVLTLFGGDAARVAAGVDLAAERFADLIDLYDDPHTEYLAQPFPGRVRRQSAYAQLARVPEWGAAAQDDVTDAGTDGGEA